MIRVRVDDAGFRAGLAAARAAVGPVLTGVIVSATKTGQTRVRALASTATHPPGAGHIPGTGPGPNVGTGDYRRSISAHVARGKTQAAGEVSTNAVQGPRLEYGFVGRDSAGRYFMQQPYPHFEPAADLMEPVTEALGETAAAVIAALIGGT